jgi:cellulose synthase/poly-beta-1,6-N-acetylglucosamine synthase-like glycosyltransferase
MISVIIPAYNAEKTISSTLEALLNQNYSKNKYEIIVVDDGSADNTKIIVKKFKKVKLIQQKHKGPAAARNLGVKHAKGDIVLFTDADCIPDKNWIRYMIEPFKNPEIVGVSGTYKTLNKESLIARFVGYEIEQRHEKMKKQKCIDFIGTFSAAYRKNIFLQFGGFDTCFKTSSGEDIEFSYKLADCGLKMVFQPKAFVYHKHPDNLQKYLKQQFFRAFWRNLMYWKKHREKILGDSYTPNLIVSVLSLNLIIFVWNKEKILSMLTPFIILLRNISWIFGAFTGLIFFLLREFK